jgi:hypothetical protein
MTTLINTVTTAVLASLTSGTPVCTQIDRVRLRPIAKASAQAVVVRPAGADVLEQALSPGYPVSWVVALAVECYQRAAVGVAPDVAVDALLEAVYARLMADPTLGGVLLALQPQSVALDFDADAEQTACATLVFHARLRGGQSTFTP